MAYCGWAFRGQGHNWRPFSSSYTHYSRRVYFSVSQLHRSDPCEGRSALLISALHSPIKAVHPGTFSTYFHALSYFWERDLCNAISGSTTNIAVTKTRDDLLATMPRLRLSVAEPVQHGGRRGEGPAKGIAKAKKADNARRETGKKARTFLTKDQQALLLVQYLHGD